MSHDTQLILQSVIDAMDCPAFVEDNHKIILTNAYFDDNYTIDEYKTQIKLQGYSVIENVLYNNIKICKIQDSDITKINKSRKKLTNAMSLL